VTVDSTFPPVLQLFKVEEPEKLKPGGDSAFECTAPVRSLNTPTINLAIQSRMA
jgi:hypothetical protein